MTQHGQGTGSPRDVPPPRPLGEPVEGEVIGGGAGPGDGLGAAGRALADAVAGLLGRDDKAGPTGRRTSPGAKAAGSVLADVISAVAGAARAERSDDAAGSARSGKARGRSGPGPSGGAGVGPGGLLSDLLDAAAPRLPIRDAARLRAAHPGASDAEIADVLVARAARLTAGVGAATGGLAAAQWFAPPTLVAVPLELGAQTVLVAAVEVVLVGELHELAGRPAPGDARARAGAYLASWSTERAVGSTGSAGLLSKLGSAGASALRRRLTRRMARSTTSMAPLLVGASLAARGNRKATVALADRLRSDLGLPPSSARP